MSYTVLARRYRSQTFDDVVGQQAVAQTLRNAIQSNRVAHAYLFTGTRGVGKTTMARLLAKALNCLKSDGPTVTPCCKCDSCVSINNGDDIDVIEIDGASNNGVDNIRDLRQNALYRPARARFKIYIIDEVHMLSSGAFNALLKILEEPPDHVKFIFATTEAHKVLPTIQSRCQRFDFRAISPTEIAEQLGRILKKEKIDFEDDLLVVLSRLANGSMRDGLSLLDQLLSAGESKLTVELLDRTLGRPSTEKVFDLVKQIGSHDAAGVLTSLDELLQSGQTAVELLDALIDIMRDILVLKAAGSASQLVLVTAQQRQTLNSLADQFDAPALVFNITTLEKLRWTIKNSESPRALLEAAMIRLALSEHFLSVPALLGQLQSGESSGSAAVSVKKKSLTAAEPAQSYPSNRSSVTRPATPAAADPQIPSLVESVSESPAASFSPEDILTRWPSFLERIRATAPFFSSHLAHAQPVELRNRTLVLGFAPTAGFHKTMCEGRAAKLAEVIQSILGTTLLLSFTTVDNGLSSSDSNLAPAAAPPSGRMSEIMNDPAVRTLLAGLDARITDIEAIEEPQESSVGQPTTTEPADPLNSMDPDE